MTTFAAIDFETANPKRNSACSVGLVIVEDGVVVEQLYTLMKPQVAPNWFTFTDVHGITAEQVKDSPPFSDVFQEIKTLLKDVDSVVAHNASFDGSVLARSMEHDAIELKELPVKFFCTLSLSRKLMKLPAYKLSNVASALDIPLVHHEALSDAQAAGLIASHQLEASPYATIEELFKATKSNYKDLSSYSAQGK